MTTFYVIGMLLCWLAIGITLRQDSLNQPTHWSISDIPVMFLISFCPLINFFFGILMLWWI